MILKECKKREKKTKNGGENFQVGQSVTIVGDSGSSKRANAVEVLYGSEVRSDISHAASAPSTAEKENESITKYQQTILLSITYRLLSLSLLPPPPPPPPRPH